jgi:hypothetical protein
LNQQLEKFKKIVGDQTVDLDFYLDPGHGWLSIPKNLSFDLNFSKCSYQDKTHYYLEEDCDAGLWLDLVHSVGIKTSYTEKISNSDSFIRDLMPIE